MKWQPSKLRAIIFDADGVVLNSEILWDKSQVVLLGRRGLRYDRAILKPQLAGRSMLAGVQLMIAHYQLDENPEDMARERWEIVRELFATELEFMHGFEAFFSALDLSRYRVAIATAMQRDLMKVVTRRLHLYDYFGDHIYHIEDVGNKSKPAPDVFLHAAKKIGVKPCRCAVIEDAPHGLQAARAAGMYAIGLASTFDKQLLQKAHFVTSDYQQISRHLQII